MIQGWSLYIDFIKKQKPTTPVVVREKFGKYEPAQNTLTTKYKTRPQQKNINGINK
jgi:hypothetical protein